MNLACSLRIGATRRLQLISRRPLRMKVMAVAQPSPSSNGSSPNRISDSKSGFVSNAELGMGEFCIIETRDSVRDFEGMRMEELEENIVTRRNRIFLLMEELRRLKIEQRVKQDDLNEMMFKNEFATENFDSALPFMPPITERTRSSYLALFAVSVTIIILFGGIVAPIAELKLGIGGQSYSEFITSIGLPAQLAEVDPIVASFCGGAVGVLSALLVVEMNNIRGHEKEKCFYCEGTGYLKCGACYGRGKLISMEGATSAGMEAAVKGGTAVVGRGAECRCRTCNGIGKVMCTSCLCTGKMLCTEHDLRLDPWA